MPDDDSGASIDDRHLLLVGAGRGLGLAIARRFGVGGYGVTLVARNTDGLDELADNLADTGAEIATISADASDPEGLRDRMSALYRRHGAPGLIGYNAVMGAPCCCAHKHGRHARFAAREAVRPRAAFTIPT